MPPPSLECTRTRRAHSASVPRVNLRANRTLPTATGGTAVGLVLDSVLQLCGRTTDVLLRFHSPFFLSTFVQRCCHKNDAAWIDLGRDKVGGVFVCVAVQPIQVEYAALSRCIVFGVDVLALSARPCRPVLSISPPDFMNQSICSLSDTVTATRSSRVQEGGILCHRRVKKKGGRGG